MVQFWNLLFSWEYGTTMLIYTLLIIVSTILAKTAQPSQYYGTTHINKPAFIVMYLFICLGLAFTDNGTDTQWYMDFFRLRMHFSDCTEGGVELGFQYYNVIMHIITDNPVIFIIISRVLMITGIIGAFYLLRDKTILWLGVLGFGAIVYLQMFSALRNGLAYSMGFLVYAYYIKNKNIPALLFAIIGVSLHRSMALFVIPLIIYIMVSKFTPKLYNRMALPFLILSIVGLYFYGSSILQNIISYDDALMNKYDAYFEGKTTQGIMILLNYFPLAYIFLDYKYLRRISPNMYSLNLALSLIGFGFALLAYQVGQLTRIAPFYAIPFFVYIGFYIQNLLHDRRKFLFSIRTCLFFLVVYWGYRFSIFITGLFFSNGLERYSFF